MSHIFGCKLSVEITANSGGKWYIKSVPARIAITACQRGQRCIRRHGPTYAAMQTK